jgi:ribosomal protein S6
MNKIYELGLLLYPSLTENEAEQAFDDVKTKLGSAGVEATSQGELSFIDLEYTMAKKIRSKNHKFDQAHFSWIKFSAAPDQVAAVKKTMDANVNTLRFILVETVADDSMTNKFVTAEDDSENADLETGVDLGKEEKKTEAPDDLSKIEGIGPKIAEVFAEKGIKSYADLKGSSIDSLNEILDEKGLGNHDPSTWPAQANLAYEGNWKELDALQEELHGGKED